MIEFLIANMQEKVLLSKPQAFRSLEKLRWSLTVKKDNVYQNVLSKITTEGTELSLNDIEVLIANSAFEEAYRCLLGKAGTNKSGQINLNDIKVWQYLARCSYELGRLEEALKYTNLITNSNYQTPEIWSFQANIFFEKDQETEAINCLNNAVRAFPNDVEANLQLGMLYFRKEEYHEAYNCFSGCCRIKAFDSFCWEMKAETLLKLKKPEYASKCFAKALRYGGSIDLLARNAYCLAQSGQVNKAVRLYRKLLKYEPNNYDALCNLAGIYGNQNKTDDAYTLLKKAYLLNNYDHVMLNNMGFILYRLGRYRKAIDYYKSALNMSPDNLEVLYNLSVCLVKRAKWDEAVTHLNKIVALQPNNAKAWMLLGNIYDDMEKHSIAADCYNASFRLSLIKDF